VDVEVEPDETFERHGDDLATRASVTFSQAALGGSVEVMLPDSAKVEVTVAAGTQPNSVIRVRQHGMPRLDRSGRGDLHVVLGVEVPTKLSKRAKQLVIELGEELAKTDKQKASSS
jgi:molecular chaperone DnaJ